MHKKLAALVICLFLPSLLWAGDLTILPDNENIQYTGRIDFSDSQSPSISWPGTYFSVNFSGSSASIILDDQFGNNYFNVIIDGDEEHPIILDCVQGESTYLLSSTLGEGQHNLLIYKRTEGEEGRTLFKGLVLGEDAEILNPPPRKQRRIEFFGDSITSGMGNEAHIDAADNVLAEKNNYLAYSSIAARELDAEYVTISQSGIGVMVSWFPFIMPDFYDQLDAVGDNDSSWNFSQWVPDAVVINLFQNDSWLVEDNLNPVPSDQQRIQAYLDFLDSVHSKYPDAHIVATLGSMDATRPDSQWPGYITTAVEQFKQKQSFEKVSTLFFNYDNFDKHPRVSHHKINADALANHLREEMGW